MPYIPPDVSADKWEELERSAPIVVERMPCVPKPAPVPRTRFRVITTKAKPPKPPKPKRVRKPKRKTKPWKSLAHMTPEQRRLYHVQQVKARIERLRASMTLDQWRARMREKNRLCRQRMIARMTPEQLVAFRQYERDKGKARYYRLKGSVKRDDPSTYPVNENHNSTAPRVDQ